MKHSLLLPWFVLFAISAAAQDDPIRIDFSGSTAEENGVTIMGAGFGEYPIADISFRDIPTDNAFEGATDGKGASIVAAPGEGILIIGADVATSNPAMIRCSVRTNNPSVSVIIASLENGPHTFVSTQTANDSAYFLNQYKRLTTFYVPPSGSFKPLIQVINTSEFETAAVMLDNFDVFIFDPKRFYSTRFIDGDEADPSLISVSEDDLYAPIDEATPTPLTPTKTLPPADTPTPTTPELTAETITIPLGLPDGAKPLEMVLIPAGTFIMGSPSNEQDRWDGYDWLPHQVTITQDFYLGKYEVTQAQWEAVMGNQPSSGYGVGPNYPVYYVSWYDAVEFCNTLSRMEGRTPVYTESGNWPANLNANGYRLPTEAEWEHACRMGTQTRFYWGDDPTYMQIDDYSWYWSNSQSRLGTYEVGAKIPNDFGLYDMSGNLWEWCHDWWQYPLSRNAVSDPTGPVSGLFRVARGGYWNDFAQYCRSAFRGYGSPGFSHGIIGFRLLRPYP